MDKSDIFYGLKSLNICEIQSHLIKNMYISKYKVVDIAETLGLSDRCIHRELAKMGFPTKRGKQRLLNN